MVYLNYKFVNQLSTEEFNDLIKSIDTVLFDVDGVLLQKGKSVIEGSDLAIEKFRKLGKKIGFVTENTLIKFSEFQTILAPFKCNLNEEIVTPVSALLDHLKEINFQKDIYVSASENIKKPLKEAGYRIITHEDIRSTKLVNLHNAVEFVAKTLEICKNVGLVFVDMNPDNTYSAMQAALTILDSMENILFFTGTNVDFFINEDGYKVIGPKHRIDSLEAWTKKKASQMGKSGQILIDNVKRKFRITDPKRVLMIGDLPHTDILFGAKAGFKTLLVLSGATKKEDLLNNKNEFYPDYVAESVAEFGARI